MPETVAATPPVPVLDRVTAYQPLLDQHGWASTLTHTATRARLEAVHADGAAVMVTAGSAGRTRSGTRPHLYVLRAPDRRGLQQWRGVTEHAFTVFVETRRPVPSSRIHSKCRCRTHDGRPKLRYATEQRARAVLVEAQIQRVLRSQARRAERRAYRCPDDDRVWHLSSRPQWTPRAGESPLWADSPNSRTRTA
ncbi:hypothetical protein [Streptomyces sp. Da 82-17]|uniref:hypothetical protein n=1 Tax=Streptomyces sp. Da 82-17 TaxID=3377116 RepID=UPI0038D386E7